MNPFRLSVVVMALVPFSIAHGQAELQGRTLANDKPVRNAEVAIPKLGLRAISDSLGRYRLQNIPRGEHLVVARAVGFRADSTVTTFDGNEALVNDVSLKVALNELPTVAVRERNAPTTRGKLAGFEERKALGLGRFIEPDVIRAHEDRRTGELLATVPGIDVRPGPGGKAYAISGRTRQSGKCALCRVGVADEKLDREGGLKGGYCFMDIYLDGAQVFATQSSAGAGPFDLNQLGLKQIEAVEVYAGAGQMPAEFNKTSGACGAIVIWTRVSR